MTQSDQIPMEWVEGAEETTLWLWPSTPEPVTVRFDREKWERVKAAAEGDIEGYISRVVLSEL